MPQRDGGPAFPNGRTAQSDGVVTQFEEQGMSLRDWFATFAPEPTKEQIEAVAERERLANPHNDHYKPPRHGWQEIRCALRYEFADAMLKAREEGR